MGGRRQPLRACLELGRAASVHGRSGCRSGTPHDLYQAAQEKRIPFAPVSTLSDLVNSEHLNVRGFFVEVAHPEAGKLKHAGAPYKLGGTPWEIRSPAPTLGQHNAEVLGGRLGMSADEIASADEGRGGLMPGPLTGIRVADFTWVWAGPTCTMQLAHMGAEVIRMETTNRICTLRMLPPWPGGAPNPNRSGYFNQYNQGKRAILLEHRRPGGRGDREAPRRDERRRRRELRRRRHEEARPRTTTSCSRCARS